MLDHLPSGSVPLAVLLLALLLPACSPVTDDAANVNTNGKHNTQSQGCAEGVLSSGALYKVCLPDFGYNRTLVIYSHGFVFPQFDLTVPDVEGEINIKDAILLQGFGYGSTSFYDNGLLDPMKAVKDLREVLNIYTHTFGRPEKVYLLGFSSGAYIAATALEKNPGLFDGALASCGPLGGYPEQVRYTGDVFTAYWAFFGEDLEALLHVADILQPDGTINEDVFEALPPQPQLAREALSAAVLTTLSTNPMLTQALGLVLTQSPEIGLIVNPADPSELIRSVAYNVVYYIFNANDIYEKMGGQTYSNIGRSFTGLSDFPEIESDRSAVARLHAQFELKGKLKDPVFALHNERDPLIPFRHEVLYDQIVRTSDLFSYQPIPAFGHCTFTPVQVQMAMGQLTGANVALAGP